MSRGKRSTPEPISALSADVPGEHKRFTWERAIRDRSELTPGQKLVAFTLATYMSNETGEAWPSLATLVDATGRSRGSLCGRDGDLEALERAGWLQRHRGGGRGHATVYRARVPRVVLSALNSSESEPFSEGNSSESETETARSLTETARSPRPNNQRTITKNTPPPRSNSEDTSVPRGGGVSFIDEQDPRLAAFLAEAQTAGVDGLELITDAISYAATLEARGERITDAPALVLTLARKRLASATSGAPLLSEIAEALDKERWREAIQRAEQGASKPIEPPPKPPPEPEPPLNRDRVRAIIDEAKRAAGARVGNPRDTDTDDEDNSARQEEAEAIVRSAADGLADAS